jgi:hypothetical protein
LGGATADETGGQPSVIERRRNEKESVVVCAVEQGKAP